MQTEVFPPAVLKPPKAGSQVLVALSTVGINAHKDSRFIKSGNSALDALCAFYVGGGFAHMANGGANSMATEQAAYALCAYDRFLSGEARFTT